MSKASSAFHVDEADRGFGMSDGAPQGNHDAISVVVAEFKFVSALIPFYRRVEMTALIGTAAVIGAVVGAVSSLEDEGKPDREAQAILLSLAPWVTVLLLLVQIMALTRIRRAALYIKNYLRPLAKRLTGECDLLRWEVIHTRTLIEDDKDWHWWKLVNILSVTSAPVIAAILAPGVAMPVIAACLHPDGWDAPVLYIGYVALVISLVIAGYGLLFTWLHEVEPAVRKRTAGSE